jgi:hypothetical protein
MTAMAIINNTITIATIKQIKVSIYAPHLMILRLFKNVSFEGLFKAFILISHKLAHAAIYPFRSPFLKNKFVFIVLMVYVFFVL